MRTFSVSLCFLVLLPCLSFLNVSPRHFLGDGTDESSSKADKSTKPCKHEEFAREDVVFLNDSSIHIKSRNVTVHSAYYHSNNSKVYVCLQQLRDRTSDPTANCENKFVYESHEYQVLQNSSVLLYGEIVQPGEYELDGGKLLVCVKDYESGDDGNETDSSSFSEKMIYVGQIGSGISILALSVHLFTFCAIPALRNIPGYNLASLSVAFLLAYTCVVVGQIPEVLGVFCKVSGILQQNFFLAAFFCMNVLAFDVWRTLKLATEKLRVGTSAVRKRQFLCYSLYSWGCPLLISGTSALLDNLEGVPDKLRPFFGRYDTCWMTNNFAKMVFFAAPAFTLFIVNGFFFVKSFLMISNNTMRCPSDNQKQTAKINYFLYLRLGIMMGLTWLLGIVALLSGNDIVWFIHDVLNSLQGLFLFLLFTCSKKVIKHIKGKANAYSFASSASEKVVSALYSVNSKVLGHK